MSRRLSVVGLGLGTLLAACSVSQAQQAVLLSDVRIVDGTGAPAVEHGYLLLRGQTIAFAGSAPPSHLPRETMVLKESGKTVMPGMVADHMHMGLVSGTEVGEGNYTEPNILASLQQYERYGVTTVTALGLNGDLFYPLRAKLHEGTIEGADLFGADRGIGVPAGAPPVNVSGDRLYRVATPEEARAAVRQTAARHPDLVKIWVDDFHGTLAVKMSPAISNAVIDEAHKLGLRVAAHVYYLADAKELVRAGADVLAHGVRDHPVDAELIALMKAHGTWYIPTLDLDESSFIYAEHPDWMDTPFFEQALSPALSAQFKNQAWREGVLNKTHDVDVSREALAMNKRNLKALVDAGIPIGFGTDSGATPLRIPGIAEHRELRLMVDAGLTPLQAIHIATEESAALLHLHDRGIIAPGKLADLVLVDGDPTAHIQDADKIVAVYHRGRLVPSVQH